MSLKRLKTQTPIHIRYLNDYMDLQKHKLSMIQFNKRPQSISKKQLQIMSKSRSSSSLLDKSIKQQNIRLVTKIMEISTRKFIKQNNNRTKSSIHGKGSFISKNTNNPQRDRDIKIQNNRLGRTLVKIKTGKSIEKIKTQMDERRSNQNTKHGKVISSSREHVIKNLFKDESINKKTLYTNTNQSRSKISHIFLNFTQVNVPSRNQIIKIPQFTGSKPFKK